MNNEPPPKRLRCRSSESLIADGVKRSSSQVSEEERKRRRREKMRELLLAKKQQPPAADSEKNTNDPQSAGPAAEPPVVQSPEPSVEANANANGNLPSLDDEAYHAAFLEQLRNRPPETPTKETSSSIPSESEAEEVLSDEDEEDERYAIVPVTEQVLTYADLVERVGTKKELPVIDHSTINYLPIDKNVYVQVREITQMSDKDVEAFRKLNGNIRVRGKSVPRPIQTFAQVALPKALTEYLRRKKIFTPMPVQCQCLPVLMAGRDALIIAETGSGKTLAYLLPMLRHCLAQPPLRQKDGPMALTVAPTRELAVQIYKLALKLADLVQLRTAAAYGGAPFGPQLAALRRGAELLIATPGRLIDVLTLNGDEADRMLDMGFEPQITMILQNIRPDRQTALVSATFPPHIEAVAKRILRSPVELVVGKRAAASSRVEQFALVCENDRAKLLHLLKLLGEWHEHGSVLVFCNSQKAVDDVFVELLKHGYPTLCLHGGHDQADRSSTLADFTEGVANILLATSVAARGLDVPSVVLVVNWDAPGHLEDYIHRVGRTGRAGNVGAAYTFITPQESDRAEDLVRALRQSGKEPDAKLLALEKQFNLLCNQGLAAKRKGRGFGGKGFRFSSDELSQQQRDQKKALAELNQENSADEEDEDQQLTRLDVDEDMRPQQLPQQLALQGIIGQGGLLLTSAAALTPAAAASILAQAAASSGKEPLIAAASRALAHAKTAAADKHADEFRQQVQAQKTGSVTIAGRTVPIEKREHLMQALAAASTSAQLSGPPPGTITGQVRGLGPNGYIDPISKDVVDEIDINDYAQSARFKIAGKDTIAQLAEAAGTAVSLHVRGRFCTPEESAAILAAGGKRLHVEIRAPTVIGVQRGKHQVRQFMEMTSLKSLNSAADKYLRHTGRYTVV